MSDDQKRSTLIRSAILNTSYERRATKWSDYAGIFGDVELINRRKEDGNNAFSIYLG